MITLHNVLLSIILDRDTQFIFHLLKSFQKGLGTQVKLIRLLTLRSNVQVERMIQTLKDMLRTCVIDFKGNWNEHLSLIEFVYTIVTILASK